MKALTAYTKSKLSSGMLDIWRRVTAAGSVVDGDDVISYSMKDANEWAPAEATITFKNQDAKYDSLKPGVIVQIEEGFVANGTVENFGGFYGRITTAEKQDDGGPTLTVTAYDLIGHLAELDIDDHYEATKTEIALETPQGDPLPANTHLAQVFQLAHTAIAKTPAPKIWLIGLYSGEVVAQTSGYEIDYENGQIIFGNPVDIEENAFEITYSYYEEADSQYIEDIIESIIIAADGYDNTPFTTANLRETFETMENKTVDTMTPNYLAETIDDVTYAAGQVWYTRYSNVVTTLAAGDFTVPGANVSLISQRYGRIILDAAISLTAVVTLNKDYQFKTIQATGIKVPVFHASTMRFRNRVEAIERLCSILPPNYKLMTKQMSASKIWAEFQNQQVTSDYDLGDRIITRRAIEPGTAPATRVVRYGKGQNPTNRCLNVDAHIEARSPAVFDTDMWRYFQWGSANYADPTQDATPTLENSAVLVEQGYFLRSVAECSARDALKASIRYNGAVEFVIGWFPTADVPTGIPSGLLLYHCHPELTPTLSQITADGTVRISDATAAEARMYELSRISTSVAGGALQGFVYRGETTDLLLGYRVANAYHPNRYVFTFEWKEHADGTAYGFDYWYAAPRVMGATGYLGIYVLQGTLEVDKLVAVRANPSGTGRDGVQDDFDDVEGFTNRAIGQELTFRGELGGWYAFAPGLTPGGEILMTPDLPAIFVDGMNLQGRLQEIVDAEVTLTRERDTRTNFWGQEEKTDWYDYTIHYAHRCISPKHSIHITDSHGNVVMSITPGSDWADHTDYGLGRTYRRYHKSEDELPCRASYWVLYSDKVVIDYENSLFLIKPDVFGVVASPGISELTTFLTNMYNSANTDPESLMDKTDLTYGGWERENLVTATFYYREVQRSPDGFLKAMDGRYNTAFQLAFVKGIIKGAILATIDLGAEYEIDAIDMAIDFYRPTWFKKIKVGYAGKMSIQVADEDMVFISPSPTMEGFDVIAGESVEFEREDLGHHSTIRYIRLRIQQLENVFTNEPPGVWPIAIAEVSVYSGLILRGEASLVENEGDADDTHLWDEDGILADLGDVLDKETRIDDFWGVQSHLDALCKGILSEYYKEHTKIQLEMAFAPHIQRGATVAMSVSQHSIAEQMWYVEDVNVNNGQRAVTLARYP